MVLQPRLYCLTSRFTHVRSLYWVLGLCDVCQGYGCVGVGHCDDYGADSSASLAQCCCCGGFFPSFAFFALVWGLLIFLGILSFIPRLHFWCCLFCSDCLFSSSLSPKVARLGYLAAGHLLWWSLYMCLGFLSVAAVLCLLPLLLLGVG